MKTLQGPTRIAFLIFFTSHIFITLLVDCQAIFQPYYPQPAVDLLEWYTSTFKDPLMSKPHDTWFMSIVYCEFLFQLPFFCVASYVLFYPYKFDGTGWFRSSCFIYGTHTSTTLVPCLTCIAADSSTTFIEKAILFGFYIPYLIFPAWLTFIATVSDDVFLGSKGRRLDGADADSNKIKTSRKEM